MVIGTIEFYNLIPLSVTLALARGLQGQRKGKFIDFIFSLTFPLFSMKWDVVLKQFMLNILIRFLSEIYCIKINKWCFTDSVQKKQKQKTTTTTTTTKQHFNTGVPSDVQGPTCFILGIMIDTTELYIFFKVLV